MSENEILPDNHNGQQEEEPLPKLAKATLLLGIFSVGFLVLLLIFFANVDKIDFGAHTEAYSLATVLFLVVASPLCAVAGLITGYTASSKAKRAEHRTRGRIHVIIGRGLSFVTLGLWLLAFIGIGQIGRQSSRVSVSPVAVMRTITTAQVGFQAAGLVDIDGDGISDYGTLEQLASPPDGLGFIDSALGAGIKHEYKFTVNVTPSGSGGPGYTCTAVPVKPGGDTVRCYFADESGVIRYTEDGTPATAQSPMTR